MPTTQFRQLRRNARRTRFVLLVTCATILVLLWSSFAEHTVFERSASVRAVAERDANLASAVEQYVVRVLHNAQAVNSLIAETYARDGGAGGLLPLLLSRARANDAFVELGLCLADARAVTTSRAPGQWVTRAGCQSLLARPAPGQPTALRIELLEGLGPPAVALSSQLPDAAGQRQVVVAVALPDSLLGVMRTARLQDDTIVRLLDAQGRELSSWRSATGGRPVLPAALPATSSDNRFVTTRVIQPWGVRVVVATLQRDALAGFYLRRALYAAVCVVATLALLLVAVVLARLHGRTVRLAVSLDRARGRLEARNAGLEATVRERTQQVQQSYRDLETFSFALAHDIRAPLAAISAYAEVLQPGIESAADPRHARYIQRIRDSARHMSELTEFLGELARVGTRPLQRTRVDVSALCQDILDRYADVDPGRAVERSIAPDLAVQADAALLRQLLENLLGNALKFTAGRAPARVEVGRLSETGGEHVTLFVRDNGAGFDSGNANGLFTPFRRMHSVDEFPGTGIGLATVHRIVTLHGGTIWCEAREGEGACFFFTLPRPQAAAPR